MAISEEAAATAAATLTAAIVGAGGVPRNEINSEETVKQTLDVYRRSLNVVRNAATMRSPKSPAKS